MWISMTVFEKINDLLVNTVLGQFSVIANDMFFQKKQQWFNGKSDLFYCISVNYVVLKHFNVNFIDSFWENQWFLVNTVLGQVSVIANDMFFQKN